MTVGLQSRSTGKEGDENRGKFPMKEAWDTFKANRLQTITYWCSFLTFGICVAVLGPTILDLGCITESTITEMSVVMFVQTLFCLLGAIVAGYISSRFNTDLILLWSTVAIGVSMAVVPFCETRWHLMLVFIFMGIFMGQIDTVANVRLLAIYGTKVAPFLQTLHFMYGLGAFLSPLVAEPFLQNKDCSEIVEDSESNQMTEDEIKALSDVKKESTVGDAYWVYALLQIPSTILIITMMIIKKNGEEKQKSNAENSESKNGELKSGETDTQDDDQDDVVGTCGKQQREASNSVTVSMVVLIAMLLFLADAAQSAYGSYIYTYTQKNSHVTISSTEGAYLTATFWGFFALGRLLSIPASAFISSPVMLFINLGGTGAAMGFFYQFPENVNLIFVSTAIYGLFLSSIYASGIAMAEEYLTLSGSMTSILVMGAAAGEMTSPLIIGYLFDVAGPKSLILYELTNGTVSLLLLTFIVIIGFKVISKKSLETTKFRVCAFPCFWFDRTDCSSQPILVKGFGARRDSSPKTYGTNSEAKTESGKLSKREQTEAVAHKSNDFGK